MSPRKLTADDKVAIVELYRESGQTSSTVAEAYGVSVSTISRLLKSELSREEYDVLVRQKRSGGRESRKSADPSKSSIRAQRTVKKGRKKATVKKGTTTKRPVTVKKSRSPKQEVLDDALETEALEPAAEPLDLVQPTAPEISAPKSESLSEPVQLSDSDLAPSDSDTDAGDSSASDPPIQKPKRLVRRRRRSRPDSVQLDIPVAEPVESDVMEVASTADEAAEPAAEPEETAAETSLTSSEALEEAFSDEDLAQVEDEFADDFDEDEPDEEESDGIDESEDVAPFASPREPTGETVEVLPIADADLSRMLYLVVDRMAELITCPMQTFQDLGQVPTDEENLQTLPIFDNHRIARRFSKRNQRVIKVPDGRLLAKTAPWLEAKGITRCLLDGQVYSLETQEVAEV